MGNYCWEEQPRWPLSLSLRQPRSYAEVREQEEHYGSQSLHHEIEMIKDDNTQLHESQLAIHRDFEQLHSHREYMRMLMATICKEAQPAAVTHTPKGP